MPGSALLSVSDKTGIEAFARALQKNGFTIIATGGTRKVLEADGIRTTSVEEITEFPECFSGRVKTLHPKILGGILCDRTNKEHLQEAKRLGITPIDLICVNLYPFESIATKKESTYEELIEQIDIGGVTLLRSAAKNHAHVTVIYDPADYERVLTEVKKHGNTTETLRKELATKAFLRTTAYDACITEILSEGQNRGILLTNGKELRYGENPHQWGKFYEHWGKADEGWAVLQGKPLSYLNLLDADAAWSLVQEFEEPTAACIKHANPSGVASNHKITEAFQRCYDADKLSAFGVIVALNRPCTEDIIEKIIEQKIFVEVIVAPEYEKEALELLQKKPNIRAITMCSAPSCHSEDVPSVGQGYPCPTEGTFRRIHKELMRLTYRSCLGGMLVQNEDTKTVMQNDLQCVTEKKPTEGQITDLLFSWKVAKHAKSNAIVFAKDRATLGIGCGQTSRVDAVHLAARKSGEKSRGAVMASDAFFPFPDSIDEACTHGISAIIQPGGSIRDEEVIARANVCNIAMVFTGVRAFRH
ncbi:bifunctional phosphoribosylaminoimidazolecarboxamide formyltransferase/IMP cyclohydrolase [Candidatus Peribacteria bacterium RIFCSPHIGHO2_01_FULL_51_9]|nr:MAG: bifunctional phosphoribosylaminoimidazolecarboxamide formyltransferase/IMP cyclohydrolase [Candidatus Peribacteria bacterium RIFCSPHIGHO2_01_FULL_51_9]